jgi:hypothetical protein
MAEFVLSGYSKDVTITISPLVTGAEIVRAYDPLAGSQWKGRLRYLHQRRVISSGVRRSVRGQEGTLRGTVHFYSELNREAARLFRRQDEEAARRFAAEALELEQSKEFGILVNALAEAVATRNRLVHEQTDVWNDLQALADASPTLRATLVAAASALETYRQQLGETISGIAGVVRAVSDAFAEIQTDEGILAFPASQLESVGLGRVGVAVSLEWESVAAGTDIVSAMGAIQLGADQPVGPPVFDYRPVVHVDSRRYERLTRPRGTPRLPPLPIPLPPEG